MNNPADLVSQKSNTRVSINSKNYSPIRAKSFNVKTTGKDYSQYVNTIKAYALSGMPFEHIANAGDYLGDIVERMELDAPIVESWKEKVGEIAEDKDKIIAWQSRGETAPISRQLPEAASITGMEVVTISKELTLNQDQDKTIAVVEGIAVSKTENLKLENNAFLKAPANIAIDSMR